MVSRALPNANGNNRHLSALNRTFTRIVFTEEGKAAWAMVRDTVEPGVMITTDEHESYKDLVGLGELRQVNHSLAYQTEDGIDTNRIESFFASAEHSYVRA